MEYTNGKYNDGSPGVTEHDPGTRGNQFDRVYPGFDDEENNKPEADEHRPPRKRKRLVGAVFLLLLAGAGAVIWLISGGQKTRVTVPVRDNAQRTDQAAARNNDDVTAQAIAEVRGATASPAPAPSASPVPVAPAAGAGTIIMPTTPVTVPIERVAGTVSPATEAATGDGFPSSRDAGAARSGEPAAQRNMERSIRCAPVPTSAPVNKPVAVVPAKEALPAPAVFKRAEPRVVLPSFGAMLPVRTLGALYTLRPSLIRFELVRDLQGENWQLKRGTIIVGQQQGSEYDRAYVSLMGFIDPTAKRFVKLTGEVLGSDGAQGLKGKRRRISSRWASVLARAVPVATALGQAALSRGSSTTIVIPGAVTPEITSGLASTNRREFVEVPAGTPAFLLITNLPKEAKGITAEAFAENMNGDGALTDEELAALLESGSTEQIRAALPRMTPELRQIAEMVLKEPGK